MNKKMFVFTDLNTKVTHRIDFDTQQQIDEYFDSSFMYPICVIDKVVHPGGSYTVVDEHYCI